MEMAYAFAVKGVIYIGIWIAVVAVLISYPKTQGRTLILSFAILSLIAAVGFVVAPYLVSYGNFERKVLNVCYLLLNIVSLAAAVCLLLYVIEKKGESSNLLQSSPGQPAVQPAPGYAGVAPDTSNPLYGINGWLKVIVVVNIYVGPVIFVLVQIVAWVGYLNLASNYPGVIVVGLVTTGVWGYLIFRGIQVAIDLRDIKPRAVQNVRTFLKLCLGWGILSIPFSFLSGLEPDRLAFEAVKTLLTSIISFAIWYSYFNVSRRVEATYPDWKA